MKRPGCLFRQSMTGDDSMASSWLINRIAICQIKRRNRGEMSIALPLTHQVVRYVNSVVNNSIPASPFHFISISNSKQPQLDIDPMQKKGEKIDKHVHKFLLG